MKFLNLTGLLRISVLALGLVLSAGSMHAQNVGTPPTTTQRDATTAHMNNAEKHDDKDWGWLGLLGLIGLAGLLPRKHVVDHDRGDAGNRTVNR